MYHCIQTVSDESFSKFEWILHECKEKEMSQLLSIFIQYGLDEEQCSLQSIIKVTQFLASLTLQSKVVLQTMLKEVEERCVCFQNNTDVFIMEMFANEELTRERIERQWTNARFGVFLNRCSECCIIMILLSFLQNKYQTNNEQKAIAIPLFLMKEEKGVEETMQMVCLYNDLLLKKPVVKKAKQRKRSRTEEDSDYNDYTCFFNKHSINIILPAPSTSF